jgi:four helix bundle protein
MGSNGRGPIRSYEDIEAFQRAMLWLRQVHELVLTFPDYEKFDLASQLRRASKSIPANIAEGYSKRRSTRNFKLYLANAQGSANEVVVHFQIAEALGYLSAEQTAPLIEEYRIIGKQLTKLIEVWK